MSPDLRQKLDRITQILWSGGVSNPITYVEQLSYLIFLKMLDEEESQREQEHRLLGDRARRELIYAGDAERFRWSEWKFRTGEKLRNFVRDDVFPYMASLVEEEPRIAEYFRDATLQVTDPHVLKQIVDIIDTIQFSKLGTDIKGDVFEHLLSYTKGQSEVGQFRTPRQIRRLMVALTDPDFGDSIYDPCCGSGGLLIDAVEHVLAKYSSEPIEVPIYGEEWLEKNGFETAAEAKEKVPALQTYAKGSGDRLPDWDTLERAVYGVDVSRPMMRISVMNLVLHGIKNAQIKRGNTISELGGLTEDELHRRYKVILSNPPFAGMIPKDSIRPDLPTNSKKSELLFLAVMMNALAPGGRCAVVVPEGLLFGSTGAHVELRRKLIADFDVLAVVSLPAGVFKPYAGVKTSVLVFRRPGDNAERPAPEDRKIWFYEIDNDGYDPDKISGGSRVETPDKNRIPGLVARWKEYKAGGFSEPPGPAHDDLLEANAEVPSCWWASAAFVLENDANLSAGRYKPHRKSEVVDEDPVELIRETLRLEEELAADLTALLASVRLSL